MKIYTVRKAITNAAQATDKGNGLSVWQTYKEASQEVDRMFVEYFVECYITTEKFDV